MNNAVVTLTQGLLGLEAFTKFKMQPFEEGTPFYTLQSLESEQLSFIVMEPALLVEDYAFDVNDEDVAELKIAKPEDVYVLVLLSIPENPNDMTANLLGPMVFNKRLQIGKQVVLHGSDWPVRHRVFAAEKVESATKGST